MSIYARKPVNKTAARVVGAGTSYDCPVQINELEQDTPIPTKKVMDNQPDLTGVRRGRFTVVGLYAESQPGKTKWVVRCDCGRYTLRGNRAIKNAENSQDRCHHCRHLVHLKRKDHMNRYGKWPDIRDY